MRAHGAGWLAAAAWLCAGAAPATAAPEAKAGPVCQADRPEREAQKLAALVESLERLERSRPPSPDQVIPLDNRGYNYGEPIAPLSDLPIHPRR
jgi:hypothetical protein